MRRFLLLAPLLLAGCGGHHDGSVSLPQYAALGAASVDLAFSGGVSPGDVPAPLAGTGMARGQVTIVSPTGDGAAIQVRATVQGVAEGGVRVDRRVILALNDPATLHAGATYALDDAENVASYGEATLHAKGPQAGLVIWGDMGVSSGGTATVVSLENGVAVLRLTDVSFPIHEGTSAIYLSGTITGTVVAAVDQG